MEEKIITDKTSWDTFLINCGYPSSFFQSWNWGEFQNKLGYEVVRLGFFDGNEQFGAASGIVIRAKRGKYLYVRNGPVLSWENKDRVNFVINSLKKLAKDLGLWHVRISPHIESGTNESNVLNSFNFPISKMSDVDALDTWVLDLEQTDEEILNNMRKTTRYEIRKAEKQGVKIITSVDPEDIDKFYPIYEDTVKRQQWTGYSKDYIKKQFETFVKDNQAKLFLAEYEGKFIAASIFIYYGNSSNYHYSGSLTEFRKIPAPALIQWKNIQEAKQRGLKRYNFWGISPENKPNHPWQGLSFFKTGFGGFAERWLPTRDIPVSPLYYVTYIFESIDKKRKGY